MGVVNHAKKEFELRKEYLLKHNYTDKGLVPEDDWYEYDQMYVDSVMELLEIFSKQGHSGFSAPITVNMFKNLANYNIITPLTGEDDEWFTEEEGWWKEYHSHQQNKRLTSLFRKKLKEEDEWSYSYNDIMIVVNDTDVWHTYPPEDEYGVLDDEDPRVDSYFKQRRAAKEKLESEITFPWTPPKHPHKFKWNFETLELMEIKTEE